MKIFQIVFASALGAVIGTMLALQFSTLWFVGSLLGGIFGWIMHNPASFWEKGVGLVRGLLPTRPRKKRAFSKTEKSFLFWRSASVAFIIGGAGGLFLCGYSLLVSFYSEDMSSHEALIASIVMVVILHLLFALLLAGRVFWPKAEAYRSLRRAQKESRVFDEISENKKLLLKWNFFTLAPLILWYLGRLFFVFLWKGFVKLYLATVSNGRITALLGASVGATAGHFLSSVIVGGLVGALIGVALYFLDAQVRKSA